MILPIVAYGDPVLRKVAQEVGPDYPNLKELISNMKQTMYNASGVGIAAPQIGKSVRIIIIDATPFAEDEAENEEEKKENEFLKTFKRVFINPIIEEETGEEWGFEEGCLSIPGIREEVFRQDKVVISYYNEKWELVEEELTGLAARVVQHEYDHIEAKLFTDYLSPLKKRLIKRKLTDISKGIVPVDYKMKFIKK